MQDMDKSIRTTTQPGSGSDFILTSGWLLLLMCISIFGAGLLGSLIYIRMLGNTIDSMAVGAKGLLKAAAGQPRLLVPVAIVMIYNRWNEILVPNHGFVHLELIPMLVGFFTYKVATFAQAIQDSITVAEERS